MIAQGLTWASELDGVDHQEMAGSVIDYALEDLWDEQAGTFADGADSGTYTITVRDAGDITGGLNAADAVLDRDVTATFAQFFDETFNRGHLKRAERPPSHSADAAHPLPLPPDAGGEFGQAAVYNQAVAYDVAADAWSVVDAGFRTADALYTANQDIWIGNWGGRFYQGRGIPGRSDDLPT